MPKKYLELWTTQEIRELVLEAQRNAPITVRDYRQGWADALEFLWNKIKKHPRG